MRIASLFDKRHLYFYNLDFADQLKESFSIAEYFYKQAKPYWIKARRLAQQSSRYKFELDLGSLESIRYDIITGEMNYNKYINTHLSRLAKKQKTVDQFLQEMNQGN